MFLQLQNCITMQPEAISTLSCAILCDNSYAQWYKFIQQPVELIDNSYSHWKISYMFVHLLGQHKQSIWFVNWDYLYFLPADLIQLK